MKRQHKRFTIESFIQQAKEIGKEQQKHKDRIKQKKIFDNTAKQAEKVKKLMVKEIDNPKEIESYLKGTKKYKKEQLGNIYQEELSKRK